MKEDKSIKFCFNRCISTNCWQRWRFLFEFRTEIVYYLYLRATLCGFMNIDVLVTHTINHLSTGRTCFMVLWNEEVLGRESWRMLTMLDCCGYLSCFSLPPVVNVWTSDWEPLRAGDKPDVDKGSECSISVQSISHTRVNFRQGGDKYKWIEDLQVRSTAQSD